MSWYPRASHKGMGVGREALHLRSISPIFQDGLSAFLICYASAYTTLQCGLRVVSWYPRFPSIDVETITCCNLPISE